MMNYEEQLITEFRICCEFYCFVYVFRTFNEVYEFIKHINHFPVKILSLAIAIDKVCISRHSWGRVAKGDRPALRREAYHIIKKYGLITIHIILDDK